MSYEPAYAAIGMVVGRVVIIAPVTDADLELVRSTFAAALAELPGHAVTVALVHPLLVGVRVAAPDGTRIYDRNIHVRPAGIPTAG